jgi:hypothetical protein
MTPLRAVEELLRRSQTNVKPEGVDAVGVCEAVIEALVNDEARMVRMVLDLKTKHYAGDYARVDRAALRRAFGLPE